MAGAGLLPRDPGQGRQAEGERLAGAGLAPAEDVVADEDVGNGRPLDRERLGDALPGQPRHERLGQTQQCELGAGLGALTEVKHGHEIVPFVERTCRNTWARHFCERTSRYTYGKRAVPIGAPEAGRCRGPRPGDAVSASRRSGDRRVAASHGRPTLTSHKAKRITTLRHSRAAAAIPRPDEGRGAPRHGRSVDAVSGPTASRAPCRGALSGRRVAGAAAWAAPRLTASAALWAQRHRHRIPPHRRVTSRAPRRAAPGGTAQRRTVSVASPQTAPHPTAASHRRRPLRERRV